MYGSCQDNRYRKHSGSCRGNSHGRAGSCFLDVVLCVSGMCTKFAEVSLAVFYRSKGHRRRTWAVLCTTTQRLSRRWIWLRIFTVPLACWQSWGNRQCNAGEYYSDGMNEWQRRIKYSESGHSLLKLCSGNFNWWYLLQLCCWRSRW